MSNAWKKLIKDAGKGDASNVIQTEGINYTANQIVRPVSEERVQKFLSKEDSGDYKFHKILWPIFLACIAVLIFAIAISDGTGKKDKPAKETFNNAVTKEEKEPISKDTDNSELVNPVEKSSGVTEDGLFEYAITGDEVVITKYVGADTEVIIPDTVAGKTKIKLGTAAFQGTNITTIDITDNVIEIADGHNFGAVFQNVTTLQSVHISGGLKCLSAYTFAGCTSLTEVVIEEGVEEIGEFVFKGCQALTSLEIPNSVKKIGNGAIGTSGVKSIKVSSDCEVIGTTGNGYNTGIDIEYK